jgi:hypothetical protein
MPGVGFLPPVSGAVGRDRGYQTDRGQKVAGDLHAQWAEGYRGDVAEEHLPGAVDALLDHSIRTGALYERTEAMRVEPLGDLETMLIPNRRAPGPEGAHVPGACSCVFCAPPNPNAKAVRWRGWDLLPNAYPYARLHSQHFLAVSSEHALQQFSPKILDDMLDLHQLLDGRTRTFHYNGWAGNTQPHLHWQVTKERLPIERAIAETATPLLRGHAGSVQTFDDGTLSGILVEGDKAFIVSKATAIIEGLKNDPAAQDHYNLLLLPGEKSRLIVIARRKDALVVDCGDGHPNALSAVEVSGRFIFSAKDSVPEGFTEERFKAGVRASTVPPSELPWLKKAVSTSSDVRLQFFNAQT